MDGGSALCSLEKLRIRIRPGKAMRAVLNPYDELRRPIPWPYGRDFVEARGELINGMPWIIVPGIPVGLPAAVFKKTVWDEDLVEVDKCIGSVWVEIDEQDWGVINARKA